MFPVVSPFYLRVSQHLVSSPRHVDAACGFSALGSPFCFAPKFMGPILPICPMSHVEGGHFVLYDAYPQYWC